MALIDKASLLMVPSTYEAGTLYNVLPSGNRAPDSTDQNSGYDQTRADFTFDRGSNAAATRVNSDGLIEKYRENLLVQSNQFDTSPWLNARSSDTSGQTGYDGSSDAWLFTDTIDNGTHLLYHNVSHSGIVTFSVYAKANTIDWLEIRSYSGGDTINAFFDLANGVLGDALFRSAIDAKIESVGNGWYRCSVTGNTNGTNTYVRIALADSDNGATYTGTGNGSIYIQNAQLETGLVATDYLDSGATTAKAGVLIDLPRINYDANGENGALLLEPSRANLVQYSEYFGDSSWDTGATTADISKSPNLSPEGVANCYYVENVSGGQLGFYTTITSGASYTGSFWVRKVSGSGVVRMLNVNNSSTDFNVDTEWTRVSVTATSTSTTGRCYVQARNTGDIIEVYGAQLEAGSYATSYIPNHGTSGGVTRAADSCSVTGVSDVIGQTEGTLFFDVNISRVVGNEAIGTINSGAYANHATIQRVGSTIQFVRNSATQSGATIVTSATITAGRYKLAIAYKSGDTACFLNGAQVSTTQTQTFTNATLNAVKIGTDAIGALPISDSVKQATLFNERLTNSELATLTTL